MTSTTPSLRYAALSDVGRFRKDNQDSGFASEHLLVIADGVGGAARGDLASATAVQILRRLDAPPPEDLLEALAGAVHRAHDRIAELVEEDPSLEGTSTTVTAALFSGARMGLAHVGDSRGYLLRGGELSQLTKDHTFVQSLIDEGRITEDESRVHPHRNLILRAVDGVHEADPDLSLLDLVHGDRILLCSDGCSGVLDNDRIADILQTGTVDYAAVELVRASLEAGSTDNITCVVAEMVDSDAPVVAEVAASATTGPMLVGAAAEQPRRAGAASKSFFRGHRSGDTGELEPVAEEDQALDPEQLRYAPRPPRRFVWLRRLIALLALVVVVWLVATAAYRWTQAQYYVAANGEEVAIFQGVRADLPGITLSSVAEETAVALSSLPEYRAEQVREGIGAENLADAQQIVSRLDELAAACTPVSASPSPSPGARSSAAPSPTSASPGSRRSPTTAPSPEATADQTRPGSPGAAQAELPAECEEAP